MNSKWIVSALHQAGGVAPSLPIVPNSPSTAVDSNKATIPTRLFLHLDINETILLGDDAGGDSRHDSVQKMLAKSAFCQIPISPTEQTSSWDDTQSMEPTHWWDGQELGEESDKLPPLYTGWTWPPGCVPYYRTSYKRLSKQFVEDHHGRIYRPILEACENALQSQSGSDHILPAFYHTLDYLLSKTPRPERGEERLPFTLIFRTFGSDIEELADLVTTFARGKHADYPHIRETNLELSRNRLYQGRWKPLDDGGVVYQLWNLEETNLVASGDAEILKLLESETVCGIRDDYPFWKKHEWDPTAGKPVWVPKYRSSQTSSKPYNHHILFDDNIHNLPHDGIACVRQEGERGEYVTMDAATMHETCQGLHLVRVPTVEPVLNPNWFVEQIEKAQNRLQEQMSNL